MTGIGDMSGEACAGFSALDAEQLEVLDAIWAHSFDDVYVYDVDGRYLYVSPNALAKLGLAREQMLGRTWQEIGLPEDATREFEAVRRRVLKTCSAETAHTVYPTTEGPLAFQYAVSPMLDAEERVCGTLSVVRDDTARRQLETELQDSEARYRALFETMRQGVVFQNRDFEIVRANEAAYRILGLTRDEVTGTTSMDPVWHAVREDGSAFPGDQHPAVVAMRTGSAVTDVPMGIKTPSFSDYHWLRITSVPLRHAGEDDPYQVVTIFEDTTAAHRAREELERRVAERTADLDGARNRLEHELAQRTLAEGEMLRTNRLLRMLSACDQVLVHALDERDLLEQVTRALADAGDYPIAAVLGVADEPGFEVVAHSVSEHAGALRRWIADDAVREHLSEVLAGGRPDVWRGVVGAAGSAEPVNVVTVPMHADVVLRGALLVVSESVRGMDAEEVALLAELAGDLEYGLVALRTRQMRETAEKDLSESYRRMERAMRNSISAMARMAEVRDPYTAGHQARVADLAYAIARSMGFDEERARVVWLAGSVHDIGKVAIPAEILAKPGELTDLERSLVRGHPKAAFDVLSEVDFPWPIAETVLQHHERLDGSGYPGGLRGDEISEGARILMVADVVEAISSHRPYRESLGVAHALEVIVDGRGTLFDPEVVDACARLFGSGAFDFTRTESQGATVR